MPYAMDGSDDTARLQAALDDAAAAGLAYVIPAGGYRLASTGLGYRSKARIILVGDLYNDHGPSVGTQYCLTNRSGERLTDVTILGQGGRIVGASSDATGVTRKGLGIVDTDGFTVVGVATAGPLTGFGMEVKNATGGYLNGLDLRAGANIAGADGLHFFGACTRISGSDINVSSGDDALSFTCENQESTDALMERITLTGLTLDSAAFSCIKVYAGPNTGRATIRGLHIAGVTGKITHGPTGGPLIMQNMGVAQGCMIEDITIEDADLDFGAATRDGPTAFLTDLSNVTLSNVTLRGRRNGQFLRAIRCTGLTLTGDLWETIPGSATSDMIQLEQCGDYNIDVVVRSASGARTGTIKVSNAAADSGTRYIGPTGG